MDNNGCPKSMLCMNALTMNTLYNNDFLKEIFLLLLS